MIQLRCRRLFFFFFIVIAREVLGSELITFSYYVDDVLLLPNIHCRRPKTGEVPSTNAPHRNREKKKIEISFIEFARTEIHAPGTPTRTHTKVFRPDKGAGGMCWAYVWPTKRLCIKMMDNGILIRIKKCVKCFVCEYKQDTNPTPARHTSRTDNKHERKKKRRKIARRQRNAVHYNGDAARTLACARQIRIIV